MASPLTAELDGGTRQSLCILAKAPSFMTQNHFQERLSNASKLTNKQTNKKKTYIKTHGLQLFRVHPQDDGSSSSPCFDSSDGQNDDGKTKLVTAF